MGRNIFALIWAGAIIAAAVVMNSVGLDDNTSLIVVFGLLGIALATLRPAGGCGRKCLP